MNPARPKWFHSLAAVNSDARRDLWIALLLLAVAVALYLPGTSWGLPPADGPGKLSSWAADELGPIGPILELRAAILHRGLGNPQYPLFHYLVLAAFYIPYLLIQGLTGAIRPPFAGYPFGFVDPVSGLQGLALLARYVTVLMAGGTAVVAYFTGKTLWDRRAGVFAAVFVMLMYPMFYYGRTSNTDVPALFWVSLTLLSFSMALVKGLTISRWVWLGSLAALAVATKDQNYAVLLPLTLPLLYAHYRGWKATDGSKLRNLLYAPGMGFLISIVAYAAASGLAINPRKFLFHVAYIRGGSAGHFSYPATAAGYAELFFDAVGFVAQTVSWPVLITGVAGALLCICRKHVSWPLLLIVPGLFFGVLAAVRVVRFRFVLVCGYVIACFAGYALAQWLESRRLKPAAWTAFAVLVLAALAPAIELTSLMISGGSRMEAQEWLQENLRAGDRIAYFGEPRNVNRFPRIDDRANWLQVTPPPAPGPAGLAGEFVFLQGFVDGVPQHGKQLIDVRIDPTRLNCPPWVRSGLQDGSLGYQLAARFHKPTLFSQWSAVNPPIEIYVRRGRLQAP
jgi:4-amino-4-deoxy-L-arabinose transferase-like glycosyltransferase